MPGAYLLEHARIGAVDDRLEAVVQARQRGARDDADPVGLVRRHQNDSDQTSFEPPNRNAQPVLAAICSMVISTSMSIVSPAATSSSPVRLPRLSSMDAG